MKFNVIGAGRLGKNIALALTQHGLGDLHAVYNQSACSGQEAVNLIGQGYVIKALDDLPHADITFITTCDHAIELVVDALALSKGLANQIIVHCSGALSSEILLPLKAFGCAIASIHPVKSFPASYLDAQAFQGITCVLEGDAEAVNYVSSLFTPLGAKMISINPKYKITYHAAMVMASNYLVTLANQSAELLKTMGLDELQSKSMIETLMQSAMNAIKANSQLSQALTGPIARGDISIINSHVKALNGRAKKLYCAAGLATLSLVNLPETSRNTLIDLFDESLKNAS